MPRLNLLILTDLHYVGKAKHTCQIPARKTGMIPALLEQVLHLVSGRGVDLVLLLGDLVDNGSADGAAEDLARVNALLTRFQKPVLAVRGNHDPMPDAYRAALGNPRESALFQGYRLLGFSDRYEPDGRCYRDWDTMKKLFGGQPDGAPVIVYQHSPVYPRIHCSYPYNIKGAGKLMRFYEQQDVLLSISGHLHSGHAPVRKNGVEYLTAAALCEAPFSYTLVHLEDRRISYEFRRLQGLRP